MNVNEIFDTIQNLDLREMVQKLGEENHILNTTEIIILAAAAVIGILLCMFGLKIVRVWAALTGLAAGFAAGAAAGSMLGLEEAGILIAGGVLGIILAVLGAALYRVGVFLLVFFSAAGFSMGLVNPQNWIAAAVCLAVSFVLALLAVRFITVLTIIVTSLCGGLIAGSAVYYLLPVDQDVLLPVLCVAFCVLGIIVQLLFESGKQKRINLKKAEEIRNEKSTANEVEKARAMMDDLDETPDDDSGERNMGGEYPADDTDNDPDDKSDDDMDDESGDDDMTIIEFDTENLSEEDKKD